MKILTVLGARPQFIKAAPLSRALRAAGWQEFILHTGQHYDLQMSAIFFEQLGLPQPDVNLGVGSSVAGDHGQQTARMLEGIEISLKQQQPDCVLVYGDTNSTLAGALAAVKLQIPLAHVEAGLRSYNRQMPEEYNRLLTDHCADLLFCPTPRAIANLAREGIHTRQSMSEDAYVGHRQYPWRRQPHPNQQVHLVGDVMIDAARLFSPLAHGQPGIASLLDELALKDKPQPGYYLATLHRSSNTDNPERLVGLLSAISRLDHPVIFPLHPRTQARLDALGWESQTELSKHFPRVKFIPPLGYLEMLALLQAARCVLTDSGGLQKEALFFNVPCVTLRTETEWLETLESGWNRLVDPDHPEGLQDTIHTRWPDPPAPALFGDGYAAEKIAGILTDLFIAKRRT